MFGKPQLSAVSRNASSPPPLSKASHFISKLRAVLAAASKRIGNINSAIAKTFNTTRETVFRFEVGGLFAFGFTMMQIGEWAASVACWVALAIILFVKALAWSGIKGQRVWTVFLRGLFCVFSIAVSVLLITVTYLRKPETEPWSNLQKLLVYKTIPPPRPKSPQPEAPLTLESLFKSDFPNVMKFTISADPTVFDDGERVTVTSQEYADFPARSSFIGYYIPYTPLTFRVCARLANSSKELLGAFTKRISMQTFDASATKLTDLTFSGRDFIYHEWPLTLQQKSTLVDYYTSKHLAVEFRGIDYLRDQTLSRNQKALKQ
jgi:hypothetical protein